MRLTMTAAALAAQAACTEPRTAPATLTIGLDVESRHAAPVTLKADVDGNRLVLTAAAGASALSDELRLSPATSTVHLAVYSATGDSLGAVTTSLSVQADYQYGFSADVGFVRPTGLFCGHIIAAVPLRSAVSDSLFVVLGGEIPHGAFC